MKIKGARIIFTLLCLGLIGFFLLLLLSILGEWSIQALWTLLSGWATYPFRILPQVSYNLEMILCGLIALALAMYFAHRFLRWLAGQVNALPSPWSFKYTSCLSFLLLSMFGTSIAMTGIIHQTAWLVSSDKITRVRGFRETISQKMDGKSLVMALYFIEDDLEGTERRFPATLGEALEKHSDEYEGLNIFCRYSKDGLVPWLYPGAGKTMSFGQSFPVIVSPIPNEDYQIVVGYSDMTTESYPADDLPPEIAVFFE